MDNTIKLLKFTLVLLYIAFFTLIIESFAAFLTGIILTMITTNAVMLLISASVIITIIFAIVVKVFINLVKGSIKEHIQINARVELLEKTGDIKKV